MKKDTKYRDGEPDLSASQAGAGHYSGDKAVFVRDMFAGIADRYDLLNSVLSFNQHKAWRRRAVRLARLRPGDRALDVCSGTGDFAVELFRVVGEGGLVVGSDFCAPMIVRGREKTDRASGKRIGMMIADALRLPYLSDSFECVTIGFGIRNVADTRQAFAEMVRVVKPGGRVVCLEFNRPRNRIARTICEFYEMRILPRIGGLISRSEAYTYLPNSIKAFHTREELSAIMESAGLKGVRVVDLNFGSVCIHIGVKE